MLRAIARTIIRRQPEPVQIAVRNLLIEIKMARAARGAGRLFQRLKHRRELKLHLGCGPELKNGWINIDLNVNANIPPMPPEFTADTAFILYDLRLGRLPLADESCALIYSSHFFEHLEYRDGVRLMQDCHRVLRPGGVFRACLPNFRRMFRAFVADDHAYFDLYNILDVQPELEPETVSFVDHVNYAVYQSGEHKCVYDETKMCLVLKRIGFRSVGIADYRDGLDPPAEVRRRYSFYVEAVK